jgi:hypothetical protein
VSFIFSLFMLFCAFISIVSFDAKYFASCDLVQNILNHFESVPKLVSRVLKNNKCNTNTGYTSSKQAYEATSKAK